MRIVAGDYGGRRLKVPKNYDIRPTSDKVRGAIFNTLTGYLDINGAYILDAFCGTGALGLEALSRGAIQATFLDINKDSLALTKGNANDLGIIDQSKFKLCDASRVHIDKNIGANRFNLIFLDPPYKSGLIEKTMENLSKQNALANEAICILESEKNAVFSLPEAFEVLKNKHYGDTLITYSRYSKSVP